MVKITGSEPDHGYQKKASNYNVYIYIPKIPAKYDVWIACDKGGSYFLKFTIFLP